MLKRLLLTGLFFISAALLMTSHTHSVLAQSPKDAVSQGACEAAGQTNCDQSTSTTSLNNTITQIINILSVIVGVVAVVMLIVGGFRFVTSGGSPEAVKGARNTIVYALIGLLIVVFAQVIARFVLKSATKTSGASQSQTANPNSGPPNPSCPNRQPIC